MDVQMPDGTLIQGVPEGITKTQLLSKYSNYQQGGGKDYLEQLAPSQPAVTPVTQSQPSVGMDVAKSIGGGLERGAAGAAMMLPNMVNQAVAGPQMLYRGIRDTFQGNPTDNSPLWKPLMSSEDVLQSLPEPLRPHNPQTAAGVGADLIGQLAGNVAAGAAAPKVGKLLADESSGISPGLATGGAATAVDAAASGVKNMAKGAVARSPDKLDEVAANIRNQANGSYKALRDSGAILTPDATRRLVSTVQEDVEATGPLQKTLHAGYLGVMKDFQKAAKSGDMGLEEADQYRQLFRDVVDRNTDKGRLNGDAMKAQTAINAMDKVIPRLGSKDITNNDPSAVQALLDGRAAWAKASKFQQVTDIVRRSGGNINKLKADMFKFASNKSNLRGMTPDEIAALQDAAKNSTGEAIAKMFGTLGVDIKKPVSGGSNVIPALETVAAVGHAPMAAPMLIGGTIAKTTQGMLGRGKVENLLQTIERRKVGQ